MRFVKGDEMSTSVNPDQTAPQEQSDQGLQYLHLHISGYCSGRCHKYIRPIHMQPSCMS